MFFTTAAAAQRNTVVSSPSESGEVSALFGAAGLESAPFFGDESEVLSDDFSADLAGALSADPSEVLLDDLDDVDMRDGASCAGLGLSGPVFFALGLAAPLPAEDFGGGAGAGSGGAVGAEEGVPLPLVATSVAGSGL